jgi:hypothetical protein
VRRRPSTLGLTFRLAIWATLIGMGLVAVQSGLFGPRRHVDTAGGEPSLDYVAPTATARAAMPPPRDPRLVPFHGLLEGVSDRDQVVQNQAYATLAEHVRHLTDEEAQRVAISVSHTALMREPPLYRGEIVQASGLLISLEAVRLARGAGPPGVEDAWRGILMDPEGDRAWIFDYVGDRPQIDARSLARVEGAFLKVVRYDRKQRQGVGYVAECDATKKHFVVLLPKYMGIDPEGEEFDDLPQVAAADANGNPLVDKEGNPDLSRVPSPWGGTGKALGIVYLSYRDAPFLIARRVRQLSDEEIQAERSFRYDYLIVGLIAVGGALVLLKGKSSADELTLLEFKRAELERKLKAKAQGEDGKKGDA